MFRAAIGERQRARPAGRADPRQRRARPRRDHDRADPRAARAAPTRAAASSSTASRATPRRPTRSTRCSTEIGRRLDAVLFFDLPDEVATERMLERAETRGPQRRHARGDRPAARDLPRRRPSRSSSTTARRGQLVTLHAERTIPEVYAEIAGRARPRSGGRGMIIRKSAREIELMAAAGAVVAGTLALLEEQLAPGHLDGRARRGSPTSTSAPRAASPTSKGYKGFPGGDLHLAQRDDRPRDPGRLPRARGRHHLLRHRRHQGRDDRRLGGDLRASARSPPRRSGCSTSAARRSRPGSTPRSSTRRSATSPPRSRRSSRTAGFSVVRSLVGHGVGQAPTTRTRRCRTSSSPTAGPSSSRG